MRSLVKIAILSLVVVAALGALVAAPIQVRSLEGSLHGFLALRSIDGALVAEGDLLQVVHDGEVRKHIAFRFKDGSVLEESVVFTQEALYTMKSYRLSQRGPAFTYPADEPPLARVTLPARQGAAPVPPTRAACLPQRAR